jgi:phage-related protein (TIGR01555 family)
MKWLRNRLRSWLGVTGPAPVPAGAPGLEIQDGASLGNAPPDPYRHTLAMPKLLPAVLKLVEDPALAMDAKGRQVLEDVRLAVKARMAMDDAGGYPFGQFLGLNSVAGLNAFGLYFPGYPYLAELAQRTEYRQPVETVAKEMTRKWITFKSKGEGDKTKIIEEITEDFETFKLQAIFRKAMEHDGFYGLGHVFMDFKGPTGDDHALPLAIDEKTIPKGSLRGFANIEPIWTTPLTWNSTDPTHPNFYKPESWMVLGRKTHQSRMLRFVSREVPDIIKPAYNFGGISLSQLIDAYVARWLKTVDSVNRLIANFSVIFLQTDMGEILGGGPTNELDKRARFFTQCRDNQGLFLTDKEREMLQQLAVPLSGLSELQSQAQEHMAAPTHLPLVVMTGITPAGLNASSEGEIEVFHDWNHSQQEAVFTDNVKKVLDVIQLNRYGKIDSDIVFDFVALKELVGEAAARVKKTQSEMDVAYVDMGAISPEEVRARIAADPESGYDNLSGSALPTPPEDGDEIDDPSDEDEGAARPGAPRREREEPAAA